MASLAVLLLAAAPASAEIVINEVESNDGGDYVELKNTGASEVPIGDYVVRDSNDGNTFDVPDGTAIPAGGYYVAHLNGVFGLSDNDQARLFETAAAPDPVQSFAWATPAAETYGRCPDGTGDIVETDAPSPGRANACPGLPVTAIGWPGGSAITSSGLGHLSSDLSGLAYQPSGSAARGVLWAVDNGTGTLYRLIFDGTKWTPDTADGWSAGKQLLHPDGPEVPDAEGVTLAGGDPTGIFVSTERRDNNPSRPAVLRYDTSTPGAGPLTATRDWHFTDLPFLANNGSLEAVTWIPDDVLVARGFFDEGKGAAYDPASYPNHGTGLFFVGVEQDGRIVAYALDQTANDWDRVAEIESGFDKIAGLEYEPETTELWASCDNECNGRHANLEVAQSGASDGRFVVTGTYARPAGMEDLNNEGFAIAPQAECVNGLKPVFWSHDSDVDPQVLRQGTLDCTVIGGAVEEKPVTEDKTVTPVVTTTPPVTTTTTPLLPPAIAVLDRTAPRLTVALRLTKATRRTGRLSVTVTLDEPARLAMTATARKTRRNRARTILRSSPRGTVSGRRTLRLTLSRRARRALRRGETVTLRVVARDAAGNATTRRVTAKVK